MSLLEILKTDFWVLDNYLSYYLITDTKALWFGIRKFRTADEHEDQICFRSLIKLAGDISISLNILTRTMGSFELIPEWISVESQ